MSSGFAALELVSEAGAPLGVLRLATLPGKDVETLLDRSKDPARLASEPTAQLREATTYRYELELPGPRALHLQPAELFDLDTTDGRSGRLRAGEAVGYLKIHVECDGLTGSTGIEIRAAKLDHETEYRQMLREISDLAADALLQGFQPAAASFAPDHSDPNELLYRRFALLYTRITDPEFVASVALVLSRPHGEWRAQEAYRSPSQPLGGGPELRRALVKGRPRRDWPNRPEHSPLLNLPRRVTVRTHEESFDTVPNRLVKFAFNDWHTVTAAAAAAVEQLSGAPRERGRYATIVARARLDEWLAHPNMGPVGALTSFPAGNQVLLKREGYREIFSAWALSSAGLDVEIDLDDPTRLSQRNIATLYEFWCYLQLASVVAELGGARHVPTSMFKTVSGGMALGLRQGVESRLKWHTTVASRALEVELYFNRSFAASNTATIGSWSRAMRPDCSLRLRPASALPGVSADRLEVWVHFDAKYRVEYLAEQFAPPQLGDDQDVAAAAEAAETIGESKRADLLKMHAYRDAIRRTVGAYVLFPGTAAGTFALDSETLPGIGAFPLRPGKDGGPAEGRVALKEFLTDVLGHVANQATRDERTRFWRERTAAEERLERAPDPPSEHLVVPPADTRVLLREVNDPEIVRWITTTRTCDVGDTTPVAAPEVQFILLYGSGPAHQMVIRRVTDWFVTDPRALRDSGHPHTHRGSTLCCGIAPVEEAPYWVTALNLDTIVSGPRQVDSVSWLELLGAAQEQGLL